MTTKPKAGLDALTLPKDSEPETVPRGAMAKGYAHTLSLRLTSDQYRRLRRFVASEEEKTGLRLTHQSLIEAALGEWLDRKGG